MNQIKFTDFGRSYFNFDKTGSNSCQSKQNNNKKMVEAVPSLKKRMVFGVLYLRNQLNSDEVRSIKKEKKKTQNQAFRYIKQELLRGMKEKTPYFNTKAEDFAKKIMSDTDKWKSSNDLYVEIQKGKNYIEKIVQEHHSRPQNTLMSGKSSILKSNGMDSIVL